MSVDTTTIKKLFTFSYNECAFPGCEQLLVEVDTNTCKPVNHREIAHIHGQKAKDERFAPEMSKEEVDHFDNVFLLCSGQPRADYGQKYLHQNSRTPRRKLRQAIRSLIFGI